MTAANAAQRLGAARRSGQWWRCICPVHGSRTGRSLTLALRDGDYGLVVYCHAGCSRQDILAELRWRGLIVSRNGDARPRSITVRSYNNADAARRVALARRIWDAAKDARESPVMRYLAGRGITLSPPPSLRWVPSLRHPNGIHSRAMLAQGRKPRWRFDRACIVPGWDCRPGWHLAPSRQVGADLSRPAARGPRCCRLPGVPRQGQEALPTALAGLPEPTPGRGSI